MELQANSWWRWRPTSERLLNDAEAKVLEGLTSSYKTFFVSISNTNCIRTIKVGNYDDTERLPLVLLHGFAAGLAFWVLNLDALSEQRNVYAIDLLGFGRSSRPCFPSDGAEAEKLFVDSIEEWRQEIGLDKCILLGHSFGAYLASSYTLSYPQRVQCLILADAWGYPEKHAPGDEPFKLSRFKMAIASVLSSFNPLALVRVAGPWGPSLVMRIRSDIQKKFNQIFGEEDTRVMNYIYHCNAQYPSGETAFMSMTVPIVYAKNPMINRVKDISLDIPITVLYGSHSWMGKLTDYHSIPLKRGNIDIYEIDDAGHHIYSDAPEEFNARVNEICSHIQALKLNSSILKYPVQMVSNM